MTEEHTYGQQVLDAYASLSAAERRLAALIGIEQIISTFDAVIENTGVESIRDLIADNPSRPVPKMLPVLPYEVETLFSQFYAASHESAHDLARHIIRLAGDKWQRELADLLDDWLNYTIEAK